MNNSQFQSLLLDLWYDLQDPAVLWQAAITIACLLIAWWLAGRLRWKTPQESSRALRACTPA